jgi:hypothetical protein
MTSSPRGRNAATAIAVVLTLALAFAWLRTSDAGTLDVPAGLAIGTVPAEPTESAGLGQGGGGSGGEDGAGARPGRAVGVVGAERRREGEAWRGRTRPGHNADRAAAPPAKPVAGEDARARRQAGAPEPSAGSGGGSRTATSGAGGDAGEAAPPEFALG